MSLIIILMITDFDDTLNGPRREKTCLRGFANNTGADQPAHPRSLISALLFSFGKVSYLDLLLAEFQLQENIIMKQH